MADVNDYSWYAEGSPTAITSPSDSSSTTWTNFPTSGTDYSFSTETAALYFLFQTTTAPDQDLYLYVLGNFTLAAVESYVALATFKWEADNKAGPVQDDANLSFTSPVITFLPGVYDGIKLYTQSADSSFAVRVKVYQGIEA